MLADHFQARDGLEVVTEESYLLLRTHFRPGVHPMSTRSYSQDSFQIAENLVEEIKDAGRHITNFKFCAIIIEIITPIIL